MGSNRDAKGRFVAGHSLATNGWKGLVEKRFGGDEVAAKEWLARIGKHAYAKQAQIFRPYAFKHPGTPEQWCQEWQKRISFTSSDIDELQF